MLFVQILLIIGHERPTLKYLSRHVRGSVGSKWYYLGIELLEADDVKKLDNIRSEHPADLDICCTKLFELWLEKQPEASWDELIKSLRQPGVDLGHLANKIEQMLFQPAPGPTGKLIF